MEARALLRKRPVVVGSVAAFAIAVALSVVGWQLAGGSSSARDKAFYSDDDGKTWFVDKAGLASPFDHYGRPAYRVVVYRRNGTELFVGYLMKPSDFKIPVPAALANNSGPIDPKFQPAVPMDIKKPGETRWLSVSGSGTQADRSEYDRLMYPPTPQGSTLQVVEPNDPNNGAK